MKKIQPMIRRTGHEMPGLNLASMPDLIFTVLFFFMIVTHMREVDLKVKYTVPAGTEVKKMDQKSAVINLYLGEGGAIQIDNELVTLQGIVPYINQVRKGLSPENQERLTISLKADKKTPMGLLADVKRELQKAYAVKVNYAGSMEK